MAEAMATENPATHACAPRTAAKGAAHKIEKTGLYLRGMMPWMSKKNLKGVQAAY